MMHLHPDYDSLLKILRHRLAADAGRRLVDEALQAPATPGRARASFAGKNLKGADLSWMGLALVDFTGADLSGADLRSSDFTGVTLAGADLTGAKLEGARVDPEQLLDTRGLHPAAGHGLSRNVWEQIGPESPEARRMLLSILEDWDGTLRQAVEAAEALASA